MLICWFTNKNLNVRILGLPFQLSRKGFHSLSSTISQGTIFREHRKFLAFSWVFDAGIVRYFQFAVLPFGLSSAPYLFTKLFRLLIKMWRCHRIPIVVFLDDGLGGGATELTAKIVAHR